MTRRLPKWIGTLAFYITLPGLYVYLRIGERTRVVVAVGDEVLVLKGWYGSTKWMLPGGGIHKGEDVTVAALRELREETGIIAAADQLIYHGKNIAHDSYAVRYSYHTFSLTLAKKPSLKLQDVEIYDGQWLPAQQVIEDKRGTLRSTSAIVRTWSESRNLV